MKPTRKTVREAIKRILEDSQYGFNAFHAQIAPEYGVEPLSIDFSAGSTNFIQAAISPDSGDFDYSQVFPRPLALVLYTMSLVNTKDQNSSFFSGQIEARLDFYVQFDNQRRAGDSIEVDNTEEVVDAIEEAALLALHEPLADWGSVVYNLDVRTERSDMVPDGEGWQQRVSIMVVCGVHL